MNIGIDARMYGKGFGLARYIEALVHGLENYPSNFSFTLYLKPEEVLNYRNKGGSCEVIEAPFHWYGWDEQTKFLSLVNEGTHDLMHFPHWNIPVRYKRPFVLTIHDLIMFHFPRYEATTRSRSLFWFKDKVHRFVVKSAAQHARQIITTSQFTKSDIVNTFGTKEQKISVIYQAPYQKGENTESFDSVQSRLHIEKPYVLYVGAAYPHKNLNRLVDAWKIIAADYPTHELLLVGTKNIWYERLEMYIHQMGIPCVRAMGFVEDTDLALLYKHATAVVYPSLYEGFGLPVLEAILVGTPVLASHTSSLPEVLGEAAYYIDPEDTDHIAKGLGDVLGNSEIRSELKIKGREQARMFSERVFIEKTLNVYKKALEIDG